MKRGAVAGCPGRVIAKRVGIEEAQEVAAQVGGKFAHDGWIDPLAAWWQRVRLEQEPHAREHARQAVRR